MSFRWLVTVFLWSFTVSTLADEPAASKQGKDGAILERVELETWIKDSTASASPRFGVITVIDKERGLFVVTEKIATAVKENRAVIIFEGERKEQPVVKFIIATTQYRYPLGESPVYDVQGQRIPPEDALERMQVGRAVVLSSDGKMLDERYRKALHGDTLILIPPVVQPLLQRELQTVNP